MADTAIDERIEKLTCLLNVPQIQDALAVLLATGVIRTAPQAQVFCAYCDADICVEAIEEGVNRSARTQFQRAAVAAHRAVCSEYQQQLAKGLTGE